MYKDAQEFVQNCIPCQKFKRSYIRTPMQKAPIPSAAFHTVSMDIVGPVTPSQFGEQYILVIQDVLTRWVELAPLRNTETTTILDKLMIYWVTRYGPPQQLLTDRGTNFLSEIMKEYCRFFGIRKLQTTAYRPQGNGQNERMHQELTKYFGMYLEGENKSKWRWLLHDAAWAYNTAHHAALGMSPYEALFCQMPPLGPLGIPFNLKDVDNFPRYFGIKRKEMLERRRKVFATVEQQQKRAIERANKHAHGIHYQKGDLVMYKNHTARTKWDPKFTGPWEVIDIISPVVYELDMDGVRFSAHAAYLKPYRHADEKRALATAAEIEKPVEVDEPPNYIEVDEESDEEAQQPAQNRRPYTFRFRPTARNAVERRTPLVRNNDARATRVNDQASEDPPPAIEVTPPRRSSRVRRAAKHLKDYILR